MTRRLRGEDGANAVEFALVLPMLLILIFGAITAGLSLNAKQQLDHAAREGARFAATLPMESDPCGASTTWHGCVRDQTVGAAVGTVTSASGDDGVCVTHVADDGSVDTMLYGDVRDEDGNSGTPSGVSSSSLCFDENPNLSGARVQVKVETPAEIDAVFFRTGVFDLVARSVSRYEEAS